MIYARAVSCGVDLLYPVEDIGNIAFVRLNGDGCVR